MKTKTFLGLPSLQSAGFYAILRNWLSIILFTGIGYFLSAILLGTVTGDIWKYIQSTEKYYVAQFALLSVGVIFGHFVRVVLNKNGDRFFILKKIDTLFYILGFVLTYLVINEIWGL